MDWSGGLCLAVALFLPVCFPPNLANPHPQNLNLNLTVSLESVGDLVQLTSESPQARSTLESALNHSKVVTTSDAPETTRISQENTTTVMTTTTEPMNASRCNIVTFCNHDKSSMTAVSGMQFRLAGCVCTKYRCSHEKPVECLEGVHDAAGPMRWTWDLYCLPDTSYVPPNNQTTLPADFGMNCTMKAKNYPWPEEWMDRIRPEFTAEQIRESMLSRTSTAHVDTVTMASITTTSKGTTKSLGAMFGPANGTNSKQSPHPRALQSRSESGARNQQDALVIAGGLALVALMTVGQ